MWQEAEGESVLWVMAAKRVIQPGGVDMSYGIWPI